MIASVPAHHTAPYASHVEHLRDELGRLDLLVRGQVVRARDAAGGDAWRGLAIGESEVDALLVRTLGTPPWDASNVQPALGDARALSGRIAVAIEARVARSTVPLLLARLAARFGLDRFALDVVLIALAPEIDLRFERLYAYLHDDITRKQPSIDLALHLLCGSLEERIEARARFAPSSPLIRSGLIQVTGEDARSLLARTLKLDDRVVAWLHGAEELDPRLAGYASRCPPRGRLDALILDPATREQLERWAATPAPPVLYLEGASGTGKTTTAEALATARAQSLVVLDAMALDGLGDADAVSLVRAAIREARLDDHMLLVDHAEHLVIGERSRTRTALFGERDLALILAGEHAAEPAGELRERGFVRVVVPLPDARAQARLWREALGDASRDPDLDLTILADRFRLTGGQIHDAAATARTLARFRRGATAVPTMAELHESCRGHSAQRFRGYARKVTARPAWDDLVLSPDRLARLREVCAHSQHRTTVLEHWGFDRKLVNGKGLGVLFAGAPGTGKTLAAAVLAAELGRDLFQIDLAAVVSKWVGETEKHIASIFDEAGRSHAVLFFDEADALFGKRTELHDAHDRYANIETSYLLQRMDDYEGIVILASNFRRNLDDAFVRRLRFILEFPVPDEAERLRIWERVWPTHAPRAADLDLAYMARRFELAGAYIRNIALGAAFLAAADGAPIGQAHLLRATRREYQKLGKMADETLFAGGRMESKS